MGRSSRTGPFCGSWGAERVLAAEQESPSTNSTQAAKFTGKVKRLAFKRKIKKEKKKKERKEKRFPLSKTA